MTLGCVGVAGFAGLFNYASGSGRVFFVGLTPKLAKNTSRKPVVRLKNPANPAHDSVWRDTPPGIGRRSRMWTAGNPLAGTVLLGLMLDRGSPPEIPTR